MVKAAVHRNNQKMALIKKLREKNNDIKLKKGITKTLVLTMIVRNEEKNMIRLLTSLKNHIDYVCITDTGSTDNTVKCTEDWCKENEIPCVFHFEPFQNFGYNRTVSVINAKKSFPNADYALLSDADFIWEFDINGTFNKNLLWDEKYIVKQYNNKMSYWNVRVLKLALDWKCWGVTHEYWDEEEKCKGPNVVCSKITTLGINDIEDGGFKHDKFERDERLLKAGILDPTSPKDLVTRYYFYLAQTLKDQRKYEESIEYYTKRVERGGWIEEVYYAKFQTGFCYELLGWETRNIYMILNLEREIYEEEQKTYEIEYPRFLKRKENLSQDILDKCKDDKEIMYFMLNDFFSKATKFYESAYKCHKSRTESLYYNTRMLRMLGLNKEAYNKAIVGCKIPYPEKETLFIEDWCYRGAYDFEFSIICDYIPGKKEFGKQCCEKIMNNPHAPEHIKEQTRKNIRFYI